MISTVLAFLPCRAREWVPVLLDTRIVILGRKLQPVLYEKCQLNKILDKTSKEFLKSGELESFSSAISKKIEDPARSVHYASNVSSARESSTSPETERLGLRTDSTRNDP